MKGEKKTYPIRWHEGIDVSSEEFPSHKEGSKIIVPPRVKRKHSRRLRELVRQAELPEEHEQYISAQEADAKLVELLLEIGFRWNWVGDDGELLAQPSDDPEVMDEISDAELIFIVQHITDGTSIPPLNTAA